MAELETTDIFKGAFYLCMGGDLADIRFKANHAERDRRTKLRPDLATFHFIGEDLYKHDKAYINGHALVNPVQFREALNHLRDILFKRLKKGRYENDRKRKNRAHQVHG
ncbi:MAG: hypothetical protein PVG39_25095 [Desulfobacteraceae bacterium]